MMRILARKMEEERAREEAEKEEVRASREVNVSKACVAPDLRERKLEHDRMNEHYLGAQYGKSVDISELERQRKELEEYYSEKRKVMLEKLMSALHMGADIHFEDQKKILWKEYHEVFLPSLFDNMYHMIIDNTRIVFSINPDVRNGNFFSKMPGVEEGSFHEKISIKVAVFLEELRRRVLELTDEQCAKLTLRSMDIMTKRVLDIEEYWREKTLRDVENFHRLKLQEMTYKADENIEAETAQWSDNTSSSLKNRKIHCESIGHVDSDEDLQNPSADHDKYYVLAQQLKKSICNAFENMAHEIHLEHYSDLNCLNALNKTSGDDHSVGGELSISNSKETASEISLQSCYSNVAELRRMNLEANMFLQRMKGVSSKLEAEYSLLEHRLGIDSSFKENSEILDLSREQQDIL